MSYNGFKQIYLHCPLERLETESVKLNAQLELISRVCDYCNDSKNLLNMSNSSEDIEPVLYDCMDDFNFVLLAGQASGVAMISGYVHKMHYNLREKLRALEDAKEIRSGENVS